MRQIATPTALILFSIAFGCAHDGVKHVPLRQPQTELSEPEIRAQFPEISTEWTRIRECPAGDDLFNDGQVFLFAPTGHLSGSATVISVSCWASGGREADHAHCKMGRASMPLVQSRGHLIQYSGPHEGVDIDDLVAQFESSSSKLRGAKKTDLVAIDVQGSQVNYRLFGCGGCIETLEAYRPPHDDEKLVFPADSADGGCY